MADSDLEGSAPAVDPKKHYIGPQPDSYVASRNIVAGTSGSAANFRSAESGDTSNVYTPAGGATTLSVPQRYAEGTEFGPRMLSPEKIAQLQSTLVQAGLIGKKQTFRVGVWDETSSKAYRDVLAYANQGGIDQDQALSELLYHAQNGQGRLIHGDGTSAEDGASGTVKQGRVQSLTNPLTLEDQVQQSAKTRLGRKLRKDEVSKFVSIYQGIEKHANTEDLNAGLAADAGTNTTLTAPPSADTAATQFLDHNNAQEEAGVHTLGFLDVIKQMVGG